MELLKVGVNFPVEGNSAKACIRVNKLINERCMSEVRFGEWGNSQPHVTVTMGMVQRKYISDMIEALERSVMEIGYENMRFSAIYREKMTERYIMSDVALSDRMVEWRKRTAKDLAKFYEKQSRTSDISHLTIAAYDNIPDWDIDDYLVKIGENIPDSRIAAVDISLAGEKGIKGQIIKRIAVNEI